MFLQLKLSSHHADFFAMSANAETRAPKQLTAGCRVSEPGPHKETMCS